MAKVETNLRPNSPPILLSTWTASVKLSGWQDKYASGVQSTTGGTSGLCTLMASQRRNSGAANAVRWKEDNRTQSGSDINTNT